MKNAGAATLVLAIVSLVVSLLLAEALLQLYVYQIAKQGKIFRPDTTLGWVPLSELNRERLNADGDVWTVVTNAAGLRSSSAWRSGAQARLLVTGDSFAFGEGVDISHRFDSLVNVRLPDTAIVNVGVMGYGTDQQLIAARPHLRDLGPGDVLVLLTFQNDFFDIQGKRHSGRAKPWFELRDGTLVEHPPAITWRESLRDGSYLFAMISTVLQGQRQYNDAGVSDAAALYEALVISETAAARERGVAVLLAFHGAGRIPESAWRKTIQASLQRLCSNRDINCLMLDAALSAADGKPPGVFLADGHWNEHGHAVVAEALGTRLEVVLGRTPGRRAITPPP